MDVLIGSPFGWNGAYTVPIHGYGDVQSPEDIAKIFPTMQFKSRGSYGESGSGPVFIAKKTQSIVYPETSMTTTPVCWPDRTLSKRRNQNEMWYGEAFFGWKDGSRLLCGVEVLWNTVADKYINSNFCYIYLPKTFPVYRTQCKSIWGYWDPKVPKEFTDSPASVLGWVRSNIYNFTSTRQSQTYLYAVSCTKATKRFVDLEEIGLLYGEYAYWAGFADEAIVGFSLGSGTRKLHTGLFNYAYRNAVNQMPALHQNTLMNLIEAVSTLRSLVNGLDLSDIKSLKSVGRASKDLLSDVWLRYRYQYNTTVADITEAASALARLNDVTRMSGHITSYGQAKDSTGHYHCAIVTRASSLIPDDSIHMLRQIGLAPSLANAWDMVPFSFIVDWFLQISNVLEGIEDWLYEPNLNATYWYSYTNSYPDDSGATIDVYFRYRSGACLLPTWEYNNTSGKTWWMRAGDTISLFF